MNPIVATIAASDSSGGAGIQADLATFQALEVNAVAIITAITAQTDNAVTHIEAVSSTSLQQQLAQFDAVKIGLLVSPQHIATLSEFLDSFSGFSVLDPVIQSSSHHQLLQCNPNQLHILFSKIDLLTPNRDEAKLLTGETNMESAAQKFLSLGVKNVLITGSDTAVDYFCNAQQQFYLHAEHSENHARGTGCTLSSAIAAYVLKGFDLIDAIVLAKRFVSSALRTQIIRNRLNYHTRIDARDQIALSVHRHINHIAFPHIEFPLGIYPIIDNADWIPRLRDHGIDAFQLRIKNGDSAHIENQIKQAVRHSDDCRLFINDYWQLAIEYGAYGVHLGQHDLRHADCDALANANIRLGISTHSPSEIAQAIAIKPSYIAFGPIFPTTTKQMPYQPQGIATLKNWCEQLSYPVIAIGGIHLHNITQVIACNVFGVAMVSAITQSNNVAHDIKQLLTRWNTHESRAI